MSDKEGLREKEVMDAKQKLIVERTRQDKKVSFMEVAKDKSNREMGEIIEEMREEFKKEVKLLRKEWGKKVKEIWKKRLL